MQKSSIEWTDFTSNPIYAVAKVTQKRGWYCEKVSPGCGHCYSETLNTGRFGNKVLFKQGNAKLVDFVLNEKELLDIIKLNNRLAKKNETTKMFLCDMTDIFLKYYSDEWLDKIFAVMALCPNIIFQVLTKRPKRMRDYLKNEGRHNEIELAADMLLPNQGNLSLGGKHLLPQLPLKNCWLGTSIENQKTASERIPFLLETPAAIRWLSIEPLLEEIDLTQVKNGGGYINALTGEMFYRYKQDEGAPYLADTTSKINWTVIGGESGNGARECNQQWIRFLVHQNQHHEIPVFVKQLGAKSFQQHREMVRHSFVLKSKKGGDIAEFPKDLQIRQFPVSISQVGEAV